VLNAEKITQIINLFTRLSGNKINKLKLIKLIYFADKYHLRKYGRTITEDDYWAMDMGPVQSTVKDIIDNSSYLSDHEKEYRNEFIQKNENTVTSKKDVDEDVLSDSDIEAVRLIWEQLGKLSKDALIEKTHQNPEWKRFETSLLCATRIKMSIESLFADSNDFIQEMTKNDVEQSRSVYSENKKLETILNDCISF
jgi:uncharacterized phage-associated protein